MRRAQTLFRDRHQNVDRYGDPDLRLHAVRRGAVKTFDPQMLFDPFEEKFDLPARVIKRCNGRSGNIEVVGQKHEPFVEIHGIVADTAKRIGVELRSLRSGENDGLVAAHAGSSIDSVRVASTELQVSLGADDEESQALMEPIQARV